MPEWMLVSAATLVALGAVAAGVWFGPQKSSWPQSLVLTVQLLWSWFLVLDGLLLGWSPDLPGWLRVVTSLTLVVTGLLQLTRFGRGYALMLLENAGRRFGQKRRVRP